MGKECKFVGKECKFVGKGVISLGKEILFIRAGGVKAGAKEESEGAAVANKSCCA